MSDQHKSAEAPPCFPSSLVVLSSRCVLILPVFSLLLHPAALILCANTNLRTCEGERPRPTPAVTDLEQQLAAALHCCCKETKGGLMNYMDEKLGSCFRPAASVAAFFFFLLLTFSDFSPEMVFFPHKQTSQIRVLPSVVLLLQLHTLFSLKKLLFPLRFQLDIFLMCLLFRGGVEGPGKVRRLVPATRCCCRCR